MKWDRRFIELATFIAAWSKDPSTQVGCVVVGPDREIRSTGFNGFPRGGADDVRLENRETKYPLVVHAEENCVTNAVLVGISLKGCTAYSTWPCCSRCARLLAQSGISTFVSPAGLEIPDRWKADFDLGRALLVEAGVVVREA